MTQTTTGMVSLDLVFDAKMMSPEDFAYRDALKWQFKPMEGPCNVPYLYCISGRLYANAPTPLPATTKSNNLLQSQQHVTSPTQSKAMTTVFAGASMPCTPIRFGLPYVQELINFDRTIGAGTYVATVQFQSGTFRLVVDTGSDVSWVRSMEIPNSNKRYDHTRTSIPGSHFDITYVDHSRAAGIVCREKVCFGAGEHQFKATWSFGAATELNDVIIKHRHQGVLALGPNRASGVPDQFSPSTESLTFIETLMKEGLIEDPYFCIQLRDSKQSTIFFGELPDIGANKQYVFQPTKAGRWALPSMQIAVIKPSSTGQNERREYSYDAHIDDPETLNNALLDTGTEYIYLHEVVTRWVYRQLCDISDILETPDGYHLTENGTRGLRRAYICFKLGTQQCYISAEMLKGQYSQIHKAFKGTICARGQGSSIDIASTGPVGCRYTFDIYGSVFLRRVFVAFDAQMATPQIAICANEP